MVGVLSGRITNFYYFNFYPLYSRYLHFVNAFCEFLLSLFFTFFGHQPNSTLFLLMFIILGFAVGFYFNETHNAANTFIKLY
ncbi:hypothetical protein TRFO_07552 [Tritrichomonas foetus]|uniref:Uncharacterized protein n=1 Tax=Tritrichomonas foetus TaxID=1144522 RepID=A0A1J4JRF4_9EUKA|nr:hypothetical protein TRFO_07552 [Tritrichomonas foetus]|eukprot:OHT01330.1 hypothetical protein TRFO_07552 [Tritrichomonas foetus]